MHNLNADRIQSAMDIPVPNILESYSGEDAINWVKVHTVTKSTFWDNEELLHMPIQFQQHLVDGRVAFLIPDRLDLLTPRARPNLASFQQENVEEVTILEWPDEGENRIEVVIELKNGADLRIVLNRGRKVVECSSSLDKVRGD